MPKPKLHVALNTAFVIFSAVLGASLMFVAIESPLSPIVTALIICAISLGCCLGPTLIWDAIYRRSRKAK